MPHRRHILWLSLLLLLLAACLAQSPSSITDVPRISVQEVKGMQDAGEKLVIVDTRVSRQYQIRRIPGAISIPVRETEDHLDELPKDATIAFYWTWSRDQTSARAALILYEHGYTEAYAIKGGLIAWEIAGYPVEEFQ